MKVEQTNFSELLVLTPQIFTDERGYFIETYNREKINKICGTNFVQDNESLSNKGILRGLHFQRPPFAQAKLIRVIVGSILDIAVDLRKGSATYGDHFSFIISDKNKKQLFIPIGFAHGFLSIENNTIINYKCSEYYNKDSEDSLIWNDKNLSIEWGVNNPILTDKDKNANNFINFESPF